MTKHLLHAVAIDPFYDAGAELVREVMENALRTAAELAAITVAMPALATGYGRLEFEQFASALLQATQRDWQPVSRVVIVLRKAEKFDWLQRIISESHRSGTNERPAAN